MTPTLQALAQAPNAYKSIYSQLLETSRLETPREAGKWVPTFILHHMADIEALHAWRFMNWLCDDAPIIFPARQDLYPNVLNYATRDPKISLMSFAALRIRNVELLATLSAELLEKVGTHPIRGQFTLGAWLEFIVKHDQNHLEQLKGSLQ